MNAHSRDFRPEAPNNIEADQALLGAMLVNNDAFYRVSDFLKAEHFYEPLHRKIFEVASERDAKDEDRINARFNREKWTEDQAEIGVLKWRLGDPNKRFRVRFEAQFTRYASMREEPPAALR